MAGLFFALFSVISRHQAIVIGPEPQTIQFSPKVRPPPPSPRVPDKPIRHELVPAPAIPYDGAPTDKPDIDLTIDRPHIDPVPPTDFQGRINSSETPLVRPDPVYPRKAIADGTEGWVELQFTITGAGAVTDVAVVDSDPKGVFDGAASKAVLLWKYAPRVEDGRAIERRGVRVVLRFDMN